MGRCLMIRASEIHVTWLDAYNGVLKLLQLVLILVGVIVLLREAKRILIKSSKSFIIENRMFHELQRQFSNTDKLPDDIQIVFRRLTSKLGKDSWWSRVIYRGSIRSDLESLRKIFELHGTGRAKEWVQLHIFQRGSPNPGNNQLLRANSGNPANSVAPGNIPLIRANSGTPANSVAPGNNPLIRANSGTPVDSIAPTISANVATSRTRVNSTKYVKSNLAAKTSVPETPASETMGGVEESETGGKMPLASMDGNAHLNNEDKDE